MYVPICATSSIRMPKLISIHASNYIKTKRKNWFLMFDFRGFLDFFLNYLPYKVGEIRDCSVVGSTARERGRRKWYSLVSWHHWNVKKGVYDCWKVRWNWHRWNSRWYSYGYHSRWRILPCDQFCMYIAIQFIIDVIIPNILQRSSTGRAFETLDV